MASSTGPRWIAGIAALIVAGACIGLLGFMLWPR